MSDLITTQSHDLAIQQPMDQNPAAVYLAALQPTGRRSQRAALAVVANILTNGESSDPFAISWPAVRFQHVAVIRARLVDLYKPATVNRYLCAVRGVLKAAWRLGQISGEDYQRAADVQSVIGDTIPAGRELSPGELSALMAVCGDDPTAAGVRDGAIIALLYSSGLRREELARLELTDYDPETGRLKVTGKRSKERLVYLTNGALYAMADWIAIRGSEPGALFWAVNKGGNMTPGRMTPQAVYNLLVKRAGQAGVKEFSPHDMRRTFVSDLLDAGADIATVAKMAGHSSVNTTARYDRRPEQAKQKAASLLHVPYNRRAK